MAYDTEVPEYSTDIVYSEYVSDYFKIYLRLPESYDQGKSYPILYLLDGDWYFEDTNMIDYNGVSGIVYNLERNNIIPECILIGIGYTEGNKRGRDFSQYPDNFYKFIKYELSEYLNFEYGLDMGGEKTLMGHSSGGYFSFYILFKGEQYFNNYISVSTPFYDANKLLILKEMSFYNRQKTTQGTIRLFMAVGGMRRTDSLKATMTWHPGLTQRATKT